MKTLKFKCTLLSDVIINQKAATEGPNKTLDFIPGSCFLGIVADNYTPWGNEKSFEIFHSGNVRFGDAHPSKDGFRGLKIPASMFYPKLGKAEEECYIHHRIPNPDDTKMLDKQLKQCRSGFYDFSQTTAEQVKTDTNFAIKSAYDREKRRSKDEQMYGYESLQKGLTLYFTVEVDNDDFADDVKRALEGEKRVGRSRTAQYGLVKIEKSDFSEIENGISNDNLLEIYADGRLIFLDKYGLPTFTPTIQNLELPDGAVICWEKSQIRIFQYAPWNYHRQSFDTDRCGIEKGSVIVVDISKCSEQPQYNHYIGNYRNEGFGKVIYNPDFLKAESDGKACYKIASAKESQNKVSGVLSGTPLLNYLKNQQDNEKSENEIFELVNSFVNRFAGKFKGESFASQWGTIRSIAMKNKTKDALRLELFDKKRSEQRINKRGERETIQKPDGYLTHGVAAEKWNEKSRLQTFKKDFFDKLTDNNAQEALINLAAEMAKRNKEGRK